MMRTKVEIGQCVTSFYTPEVLLTHLSVGLEECPRMGFPGHVLHRAVNNQDVIKMSDGHRNVVITYNIFSVV